MPRLLEAMNSRTAKRVSEAVKYLKTLVIQMHLSHVASLEPHSDCINNLGPEASKVLA
jgi:hypothetical protein